MISKRILSIRWTVVLSLMILRYQTPVSAGNWPNYPCYQNGVNNCTNYNDTNGVASANPYAQLSTLNQYLTTMAFNQYAGFTTAQDPPPILALKMPSKAAMINWNLQEAGHVCSEICEHQPMGETGVYWYHDQQGDTFSLPPVGCSGSDIGAAGKRVLVSCGNIPGVAHSLTSAQLGWTPNEDPLRSLPGWTTIPAAGLKTEGAVESVKCLSATQVEVTGWCKMDNAPGISAMAFVSIPYYGDGTKVADILRNGDYDGFDITFNVLPGMPSPVKFKAGCTGNTAPLPFAPGYNPNISCGGLNSGISSGNSVSNTTVSSVISTTPKASVPLLPTASTPPASNPAPAKTVVSPQTLPVEGLVETVNRTNFAGWSTTNVDIYVDNALVATNVPMTIARTDVVANLNSTLHTSLTNTTLFGFNFNLLQMLGPLSSASHTVSVKYAGTKNALPTAGTVSWVIPALP